jgi:hypothetical protein
VFSPSVHASWAGQTQNLVPKVRILLGPYTAFCMHALSWPVRVHADVTFIGTGSLEARLSAFNVNPEDRWYAKGCTFKRADGILAPFQVDRGAALALDGCSIEDSQIDFGTSSRKECPIGRCKYEDDSPVTRTSPQTSFFRRSTISWLKLIQCNVFLTCRVKPCT